VSQPRRRQDDGGTVSIDLHEGELVVTTSKEKDEGTAAA
jgi:hypothetical protein